MTILEYYKEMCLDENLNKIYYSTGDTQIEGKGKIFSIFNTNYRTLFGKEGDVYTGFGAGFNIIDRVAGKPYNEWEKYAKNDENRFKQHTVRMRKSDLFSVKNGIYNRTKRGDVFYRMMNTSEDTLSINDKRFLCYLLILSGHFNNTHNYIFERTKAVFNAFSKSGFSETEILKLQKQFLLNSINSNKYEVLKMDYTYLHSFCLQHNEIDFNNMFRIASENDKADLFNYVLKNLKDGNDKCILAHKYKNGGNYTVTMLQNSAMILYLTKNVLNKNYSTFDDFIYGLIGYYSDLYTINKSQVHCFIFSPENIGVFERIYNILFDINHDIAVLDSDVRCVSINDKGEFDTTDEEGAKKNDAFTEALKRLVKTNSDYKCILHNIENCTYFTAKESGKNYLEVHHFIPRAFSNDFENSIEIKDNYIPLCPKCHRKIHLAVDRERKNLINYIYDLRKDKLKEDGLIPNDEKVDNKNFIDILYEYYNIDE